MAKPDTTERVPPVPRVKGAVLSAPDFRQHAWELWPPTYGGGSVSSFWPETPPPYIGGYFMKARQSASELFKVKVIKVNTMNVRGKLRRQRTPQAGQAPSWKKAIVTLKEGDKIVLT